MTGDNLLPPIDPNELGTGRCYFIDDLLVPYLIPRIYLLTSTQIYEGDYEDIVGTHYAFEELLSRLTGKRSCMLGQVVLYFTQNPPVNSLPCDGAIYQRVDYPELWDVLHENLKINANEFRVPDMRQRSPKGYQAGEGLVGALQGNLTVQLAEENIPQHTHAPVGHGHEIADGGHTHTTVAHDHALNDPGHNHTMAHDHSIPGRLNSTAGSQPSFMVSTTTGSATTRSSGASNAANTGSQATGIDINPATVDVNPSSSNVTVDFGDAYVENWGGNGAGETVPFSLLHPVTVVQYALICR